MLFSVTLSLLAVVSANPQPRKPAAAPFVLEGVWVGEEVGDVGSKHPTITFTKDGGTLAYDDANGGTGSFTMRLQAVKVEGTQVHFSVPGGGKLRLWSGRWDGHKLSGTIAADASGGPQIGTFELKRPVYEDGPRRPSDAPSHSTGAAAGSGSPAPGGEAAASEGTPGSERDAQQEAGAKRLEERLSQISDQASQLLVSIQDWQASCRSGGTPLYDQPAVDCNGMARNVGRLAFAVGKGLEEAEDEARRAGVLPGTVRQLRADHGLDSSKWDELSSKVRQLEAEARLRR